MIIEKRQKYGGILDISYVDENLNVVKESFLFSKYIKEKKLYKYTICDEDDPDKEPLLRHYENGEPVKKVPSNTFDYDEERQFMREILPQNIRDKLSVFRMPKMYSCDIEIDIGDDDMFPDPYEVRRPVDSIQITTPDLDTVILTINDRCFSHKKRGKDYQKYLEQKGDVEKRINEFYKNTSCVWNRTKKLNYQHIKFDSEEKLLEYWWHLVNTRLFYVSFWNGENFDCPYLYNRSKKLGVDVCKGCPDYKVSARQNRSFRESDYMNRYEVKDMNAKKDGSEEVLTKPYFWPKHRIVIDYLTLTKQYGYELRPMISYKLDKVAEKVLGIGKVSYDGTFKDLFNGPINRYLMYSVVDAVAMQLIALEKDYAGGVSSLASYCDIPFNDAQKTTTFVNALIWNELYSKGFINGKVFKKAIKEPYGGGFVKEPVRKFVMWPVCVDFSALYPQIMRSFNISFENYICTCEIHEVLGYIKKGYVVTPDLRVFKNDKDYTLRNIETCLLKERYDYKGMQFNMWNYATILLDVESKRRKIVEKITQQNLNNEKDIIFELNKINYTKAKNLIKDDNIANMIDGIGDEYNIKKLRIVLLLRKLDIDSKLRKQLLSLIDKDQGYNILLDNANKGIFTHPRLKELTESVINIQERKKQVA